LLKESFKVLKVSQGSIDWKAYVDYINGIVEDGLTQMILKSID
jgi:dynein heavy chain